jgi:hypothetical protein
VHERIRTRPGEHMSKKLSRVEELQRSAERAQETQRRHIAAIQADRQRAMAALEPAARERRRLWGPSWEDLEKVVDAALEAETPLRGAPNEDTMRVSVPSSEKDEGASTRRHRDKANQFRRDMQQMAARYAPVFGVELPDRRDYSAHVRWHESRGRTEDACQYCEKKEAS